MKWLGLGLVFLVIACIDAALARDQGQWEYASPDLKAYYASLMKPDAPKVSCCGEADAYYADKIEECKPSDGEDCALVAIITDTRDDESRGREHIDVGTRVPIPRSKVRKHPVPNPTDHNIVFVSAQYLYVHCWEPVAGL